jgi:hypothetical protein
LKKVASAKAIVVALNMLVAALTAAHAQQRTLEDRYIADRDRGIRQFENVGNIDQPVMEAEAKVRAGLETQMRAILGPTAPAGYDGGKLNLSTLFKGDQGFGTLDGLLFSADGGKREMTVTTRTLLVRWLAGHKTFWKKEPLPGEPGAAFRSETFWNQAIETDAHITPLATVPLDTQGAAGHAVVGGRSQDQAPNVANEMFIAAVKGERAFVLAAVFEPVLAVASCNAERAAAEQKVNALREGAPSPGKELEALNKRIEATSEKMERDFVQCFGARAAKEPGWGAVVKLAKELFGAMKER